MDVEPGTGTESGVAAPDAPTPQPGVGAGTVALIATWIGLIAGFCDLGALVVYKRLIARDFYHLGADFPWLIPLGVTALVFLPASLLILIAWRRGSIRLGVPVGLLSFLGFLDLCSRLRLELWATVIISIGLATQSVRFVRRRREGFLRSVRWSVGWLVAALVATMLVTVGGRWWQEYRQGATLPQAPQGAPNVLLIVWDTVRASNTSLHGYRRATTPNLDRLARRGVKFDLAFATSSWTLPSHASLFTGRWPHEVGVNWKSPVREGVPTLAGSLAKHGYDTAGFVANLDYCSRETGLARGFAHYEDFPLSIVDTFTRYIALGRRIDASSWQASVDGWVEARTGRWHDLIPQSREHTKDADAINGAFLGWLANRTATRRPFFAFLNYNDAHSPYEVPDRSTPGFGLRPSTSAQRQTLQNFTGLDKTMLSTDDVHMAIDVYDDSIAYLDRRLGSLLEELGRKGVLENTLIIVTSDHGEHLGDHRLFFHGCSLYRQLVHVPLVIAGRKRIPEGRTVAESVGLCDLPSTVIDVLGLASKPAIPGRSFAKLWRPRSPDAGRIATPPLLMETTKPELLTNDGREPAAKGPMKAVVAAGMHYIQMADGTEELFNLGSDPEETNNLARTADAAPVVQQLRGLVRLLLRKR